MAQKKKDTKKKMGVTTHSHAQIQGLLDGIVGIMTEQGSHLFNDAIWGQQPHHYHL